MSGAVGMFIVDAVWTPRVNMLIVECKQCGRQHRHRADRWNVRCPSCGVTEHLSVLRDRWVQRHSD